MRDRESRTVRFTSPELLSNEILLNVEDLLDVVMTENGLCDRFADASPGEAIVYHIGLLARDRDKAGEAAFAAIAERCATSGIEVIPLMPILGDFNDDLRQCSREAMEANLARQLGCGDEALLRKA